MATIGENGGSLSTTDITDDALPISPTNVDSNPVSTSTINPAATASNRPAPPDADSRPIGPEPTDPAPDCPDADADPDRRPDPEPEASIEPVRQRTPIGSSPGPAGCSCLV